MDVIAVIGALVANPMVQGAAVMASVWAVKVAWDFAAAAVRLKGKQEVDRAQAALNAAKLTPDQQDDVIAQMAFQKAKENQEFADKLAALLEQNKPPLPGGK